MRPSYVQYLFDLIEFRSVTPNSAGAVEYLADTLESNGFDVILRSFGTDYKVTNLYASYTASKHLPNLCFAGHIDVVPAGNLADWITDPFKPYLSEDKVYGRGAVDMKGAIACMLSSSSEFLQKIKIPNFNLSFLITSDEEGKAEYGSKAMLEHIYSLGHKIDLAILGEPTCESQVGDTIKIARRGSVNFNLQMFGKQGHVAYPEKAINPITELIPLLSSLVKIKGLQITSIDTGNQSTNVIPSSISILFNVRFEDQVEDVLNSVKAIFANSDVKLEYSVSAYPFVQKPTDLMIKFKNCVSSTLGIDPVFSIKGGTSDARFIKDYCSVIEFGLLSESAHQVNEYTKISDLQKLHNVYYEFLQVFQDS